MAEIELNVLNNQCLGRRIDSVDKVRDEVEAWEKSRNGLEKKINWQFALIAILAIPMAGGVLAVLGKKLRSSSRKGQEVMGEIYHRKGYEPDAVTCYRKARKLDAGVWVPPDVDLNGPTAEDPKPKRGLLGSFRALLGGRK